MCLDRYAVQKSRNRFTRTGPGRMIGRPSARGINIYCTDPCALRPEKHHIIGQGEAHRATSYEVLHFPCANVDQCAMVGNFCNNDFVDDSAACAGNNFSERL